VQHRKTLIAAIVFGAIAGWCGNLPRFQHLMRQTDVPGYDDSRVSAIEVWHDTQSGVEFICVFVGKNGSYTPPVTLSCFPTGRNWK
jgi:hypothetical protein